MAEVLEQMEEQDYISSEEADDAKAERLKLKQGGKYDEIKEPYFFDYVEQQLIEEYGVNTVRQGGLKVYTTIVPELQVAGREAIENNLYYSTDPSAAVVSIDPGNGYVLTCTQWDADAAAKFRSARRNKAGERYPSVQDMAPGA